ncbi:MAG: (Fe-S)-binding protein [Romboutsia sp.]
MELKEDIIIKINKDKNQCVDCKLCFNDCTMMKNFSNSPKELMIDILNENIDINEVSYSCMLCGLCTERCPQGIDLKSTFCDIRKDIALKDKKILRKKGYSVVRFHQINSFSKMFSKNINLNKSQQIFLPGCSLSSYSEDIVLSIYEYLKIHYENIGMTFMCCGKPTLAMGDIKKFEKYYSKFEKEICSGNITEIIVACPNCYNTISKNSKGIKVTSIYEVIKKFKIPEKLKNNYQNLELAVHDSCSVRGEINIHDSVRSILSELGVSIVEFKNNRKNTVCCGAGGMVGVTNLEIALKQVSNRASETSCENIVCYCESCCESLINCNKNILHILDLLFNEDVINHKKITQSKRGTMDKWKIRYKTNKLSK